jgi:hypothetical protein
MIDTQLGVSLPMCIIWCGNYMSSKLLGAVYHDNSHPKSLCRLIGLSWVEFLGSAWHIARAM